MTQVSHFAAMSRSSRTARAMCTVLLLFCGLSPASGQSEWPTRSITLIVPTAPGSGADALARIVAPALQKALGQPVVVDNRAGANSQLGARAASLAAPDGYTLFLGSATTHAVNPSLYGSALTYKPQDLEPVALLGAGPALWLVSATIPVTTVNGYVEWAQKNTSNPSCAYGNSVGQVACELVRQRIGAQGQSVPYRSTPQALTDLAGGIVTSAFADVPAALPYIQSGKVKVLAVAHTDRLSVLSSSPTMTDLAHPSLQVLSWTGVFVPKGTPQSIQKRINALVEAINNTPEGKAQLARTGGVQLPGDIAYVRGFVSQEASRWQAYIRETGIKPE